ncbi:MAG: UDP-N-acetylmuramoyl-L-alanine--D-glutamate ligase [Campylobacterales bacterium]|nr:UDP-N-acetylmuramoyl-L-alanine--D-glutamate ligase [Campylobacterales bacterium]
MKPTLFGYGLTTKAIAASLGGGCKIYDDNASKRYVDDENNEIIPSHEFDPTKSSLEVTTPSFPPAHPLIQKAQNLISEYDYLLSPSRNEKIPFTIWISGTNGKTTTTQMVTHLLAKRGALSGGNIGTPIALLDREAPIWVLESSSFTLHHTCEAFPNIYLLLPITPDHLDWHGSAEEYEASKLKPLLGMAEGEMALIPKGLNLPRTNAFMVEYDSNDFLAHYFDIDTSKINFRGAFLQDALLALAVTKVLFDEVDYDAINNFRVDAHRQEEIQDKQGRLWINDSKATNIDAAIQAILTYSGHPIHLILGGDDKGVELDELFLAMPKNIRLYAIGSNTDKLIQLAQTYSVNALACETLGRAVEEIAKVLKIGEAALLSPAAASKDQFKSYVDRGEQFRGFIKEL